MFRSPSGSVSSTFQQRDEVLAAGIKQPFALFQERLEVLAADAVVGLQPVLRIGPEPLDAVDVVGENRLPGVLNSLISGISIFVSCSGTGKVSMRPLLL